MTNYLSILFFVAKSISQLHSAMGRDSTASTLLYGNRLWKLHFTCTELLTYFPMCFLLPIILLFESGGMVWRRLFYQTSRNHSELNLCWKGELVVFLPVWCEFTFCILYFFIEKKIKTKRCERERAAAEMTPSTIHCKLGCSWSLRERLKLTFVSTPRHPLLNLIPFAIQHVSYL